APLPFGPPLGRPLRTVIPPINNQAPFGRPAPICRPPCLPVGPYYAIPPAPPLPSTPAAPAASHPVEAAIARHLRLPPPRRHTPTFRPLHSPPALRPPLWPPFGRPGLRRSGPGLPLGPGTNSSEHRLAREGPPLRAPSTRCP